MHYFTRSKKSLYCLVPLYDSIQIVPEQRRICLLSFAISIQSCMYWLKIMRISDFILNTTKWSTDRSEAVFLLWIFYVFVLSCVCFVFVRVCLYVLCGHLQGKGWPLGSRLWCLLWVCHFPIGILGQVWYLIVSIPDLCTITYSWFIHKRFGNSCFVSFCWCILSFPTFWASSVQIT